MPYKAEPTARPTDWKLVWLLFLVGVFASFQIGKVPPSLPFIREDLSLSLVGAGWVMSIMHFIGALSGSIAGAFADWLGHRRLMLSGLWLMVAANLLGALATGAAWLLASRVLEGLAFLMAVVSAPALIGRVAGLQDQRQALGIWSAFVPLGMAAIMLLAPLCHRSVGWRGLWLANALLVAALIAIVAPATRRLAQNSSGPFRWGDRWQEVAATVSRPGPLILAFCFAVYSLQYLALFAFLPIVLIDDLKMGAGLASLLTALAAGSNAAGNIMGGWLLQRGQRRGLLLILASLAMAIAGLGVFSAILPGALRYWLCICFSVVGGVIPACLWSGAAAHAPKPGLKATTNGLITQGSNLGSSLGPPALALAVAAAGGWQGAPWLMLSGAGAVVVLGALLALLERGTRL